MEKTPFKCAICLAILLLSPIASRAEHAVSPIVDGGRAYQFVGSALGPSSASAWTISGDTVDANLGISFATGDINNDGYKDVVVGARRADNHMGKAYLYLGTEWGLEASAAWITYGEQIGAYFGSAVAVGDVNGDGYDDVVVGSHGYDTEGEKVGKVYLYLASSTGLSASPAWTLTGNLTEAYLGAALGVGDVDGDAYDDIVIGEPGRTINAGKAYLYLGPVSGTGTLSGADWNTSGEGDYAFFGGAIVVGNVNGGADDIVVGAPGDSNGRGKVYLYLGVVDSVPSTTANETLSGSAEGVAFGAALAIGDVSGEGKDDVAVGEPAASDYTGKAYLYLGPALGQAWTGSGAAVESYYGAALSIDDVTDDGFGDLLVGAPGKMIPACFIATVCYGTPMASEVKALRDFRDRYLLTNPAGQAFVRFYYTHSPPLADFIRDKGLLKAIIRAGLKPLVWLIEKNTK